MIYSWFYNLFVSKQNHDHLKLRIAFSTWLFAVSVHEALSTFSPRGLLSTSGIIVWWSVCALSSTSSTRLITVTVHETLSTFTPRSLLSTSGITVRCIVCATSTTWCWLRSWSWCWWSTTCISLSWMIDESKRDVWFLSKRSFSRFKLIC